MESDSAARRPSLRPVIEHGRYFEAPRWHAGRLWVSDAFARKVYCVDSAGTQTVVCEPDDIVCGIGHLPSGDLLIVGMRQRHLWRLSNGVLDIHADLSIVASGSIDDMIVDVRGNAYLGDTGFDLSHGGKAGGLGRILLVTPDGRSRVVATGLDFPNGIAVSGDGTRLVVVETIGGRLCEYRVEADGSLSAARRFGRLDAPDGVCLDESGYAWVGLFSGDAFVRVAPSGEIAERIATPDRRAVACCLGGPDRKSLFCATALTTYEDLMRGRSTSRIDAADVEVGGDGAP